MTSSELSNALNPNAVPQKPRPRQRLPSAYNAPVNPPPVPVAPQPSVPHRSELELAFAAVPPPPPPPLPLPAPAPIVQVAPAIQQQPPTRSAATIVQDLYRLVAAARDAAAAEKTRRISWEGQQDAQRSQLQAELERQIADMRKELAAVKAYLNLHPNLTLPASLEEEDEALSTAAYIEEYFSPLPEPAAYAPMSPVSPVLHHPPVQQPMFIEGSSSRPLTAQGQHPYHAFNPTSSSTARAFTSPTPLPPDCSTPMLPMNPLGLPTPQSVTTSPTPTPLTPGPEPNALKRPRPVLEDYSDYETDTEDSDTPATDRPLKRKNGHDGRCLTIHHALRIHIRKMMKLHHGEALPPSAFEGVPIGADEPVRFVWDKTPKQSATNAAMKQRVVADLRASRHKYKHVPEKEFAKKAADAAFEQVFTTLRQKYKAENDAAAASRLKRREDHKALKARRLLRKKTKLAARAESRSQLAMFAQPAFDGALQPECMSSEESDGEEPASDGGPPVAAFRTRGPPWRSARLRRLYMVLDDHARLEKSGKPRRGLGRRKRHDGPPKDGLALPPKGVARWMVSKRWLRETEATRTDVAETLREHFVDPVEPELLAAQEMLGPEDSEVEEQTHSNALLYGHVSDTSYSLYNALQPV